MVAIGIGTAAVGGARDRGIMARLLDPNTPVHVTWYADMHNTTQVSN